MSQLVFWIASSDPARARRWETLMTREGWQVSVASDVNALAADVARQRFGLVLADWSLFRPRPEEAVRRVKAASTGVSVILIAGADAGADKVIAALEAGCDDSFPDDIDDRLLLAKMKAHLRRILPSLASALDVLKSSGGELKIDRSRQEAWVKGTRTRWSLIPGLTRTEFDFLALFLQQPGKVLERGFILETVWKGQSAEVQPGTVDKHVESLRRKLGRYGPLIRTIYGVGYALRED
ncbi:MAG: response regulator transcription factor [Elusimicrobia bacterium]|nr:response regulator transcription factor [Elusimicrobiota bacterium]